MPQGRRSTSDRANLAPELNAYMKGKVPKGEVSVAFLGAFINHDFDHLGECCASL